MPSVACVGPPPLMSEHFAKSDAGCLCNNAEKAESLDYAVIYCLMSRSNDSPGFAKLRARPITFSLVIEVTFKPMRLGPDLDLCPWCVLFEAKHHSTFTHTHDQPGTLSSSVCGVEEGPWFVLAAARANSPGWILVPELFNKVAIPPIDKVKNSSTLRCHTRDSIAGI